MRESKGSSPLKSFIKRLITKELNYLYRESIIYRVLGRRHFLDSSPFDYRVKELGLSPPCMLFYNIRAIVLGFGFLYLISVSAYSVLFPVSDNTLIAVAFLGTCWLVTVLLTLLFHHTYFLKKVKAIECDKAFYELPRLLDPCLILDYIIIFSIILIGYFYLKIKIANFAFLLIANLVIFTNIRGKDRIGLLFLMALFFVFLISMVLAFPLAAFHEEMQMSLIAIAHQMALFFAVLLVVILPNGIIAWLRIQEQRSTQCCIELLGRFEKILFLSSAKYSEVESHQKKKRKEIYFRRQVMRILRDLCSLPDPFWYRSACLWFVEKHQDRGEVIILGPSANFDKAKDYENGIDVVAESLLIKTPLLLPSVHSRPPGLEGLITTFFPNLDVPAAIIPLLHEEHLVGLLTVYGDMENLPIQPHDAEFLKSLALIIRSGLEQSQHRHRNTPRSEMDNLFTYDTMEEVFPKAAEILKRYLVAEGCMVIFRPDPNRFEMEIVSKENLDDVVYHNEYNVDRGVTGECARRGITIRYDDMERHRHKFDREFLLNMEKALGSPIRSWMAIPIGPKKKNFGVIKVVNRTYRCSWFTEEDKRLGEELALRLHVIIEKFLNIRNTEEVREQALHSASQAEKAAFEAKKAAMDRQNALMTMTHQVLGPLISSIGSINRVQKLEPISRDQKESLAYVHAFIEDTIALCYGTSTTFALSAGEEAAYSADIVDAPKEMKRLSDRLKMTNSRIDLLFEYKEAPGFPQIQMDLNIFTSIMYSLLHNAMKYADRDSRVLLDCSYEEPSGKPALKVKSVGPQIQLHEVSLIFEQFKRGYFVKKGMYHHGVGLGLWVARELVRSIGGDLTVELSPEYPRLSAFVVTLPNV